ncbi:MAG: hypothetical protein NVS9B7_18320 [Flavisolibacter sp.]
MNKYYCGLLFILLFSCPSLSANSQSADPRIKLFIDCSNTFCDQDYIKTKIKFVDYVLDNQAADIHLLITQQTTGGGASQYQLIFYGQHRFYKTDTLHFHTKPNNTSFEIRDQMIKYIEIGLLPFISQTRAIENIGVQLKDESKTDSSGAAANTTKDPWNYWVFRTGVNGNLSTDANYKSFKYNGNVSASRITDNLKLSFSMSSGKNRNTYQYTDVSGTSKIIVKNENYDFSHQLAKSVSQHFSIGYDIGISHSTFNNYKLKAFLRPAVEYDIFPYKEVNNKLFTLRYGIDITNNHYIDTTLYFKTEETLPGQQLDAALTYNQKWGTINLFGSYHSFWTNLSRYNFRVGGGASVRITGGLSVNIFVFGNYLRDQIYLPKGRASFEDILTRQRQLATNYSILSFFGINYRFGSKLNNFVNPRFNSGGGTFFFSN